ncbi:MAG: hypothetical protein B7X86_07520 [Sphingobacteriales bacterium 17-39-43]|nr:MAG: hypothetical protein B7Y24_08105 [Sphingobacteriales bacterium 16-39-50]OYZ53531.1 MAG: hypothetical protein B7Y19_05460 [Sphingobacteriales bacterium 24-40-4]OZA24886.1 MAG: hypothetical protein B7X86_07520 [Sphingobacteriales bacterium 17-39-43]
MSVQYACPTTKFSNRQLDQLTRLEQTDTLIREQENIHLSHDRFVTDSIGQVYQITIFPRDSFQFSVEKGFIGKASKVELRGSIRQLNRVNDSIVFMVSKGRETKAKAIRKVESRQINNSKSVEKSRFKGWQVFVAAGAVLLLGWVYQRYRK